MITSFLLHVIMLLGMLLLSTAGWFSTVYLFFVSSSASYSLNLSVLMTILFLFSVWCALDVWSLWLFFFSSLCCLLSLVVLNGQQNCGQHVFVWLHVLLHNQYVLFLHSSAPTCDHYVLIGCRWYPHSLVFHFSVLVAPLWCLETHLHHMFWGVCFTYCMASWSSVRVPRIIRTVVFFPVFACPCKFLPSIADSYSVFLLSVGCKVGSWVPNMFVRGSTFLKLGHRLLT